MKTYRYFVSFNHACGAGNLEILRASEIITMNDIKGIERTIIELNKKLSGVVLINYKLLRVDEKAADNDQK